MRKTLLLAGIFTVLTYNAQARYNEEYMRHKQHYVLSEETTKNYNKKYIKNITPYIGLNLGITSTKFSNNILINDETLSDHNLIISPNIGIRHKYLGIEAFYQHSENSKKNINENIKSSLGFYSFGTDLMGYIPINTELEILASLGFAKYCFKAKGSLQYEDIHAKVQKDFNTNSIRYGLGIQHVLKENVSIRAMAHYIKMDDKEYIKNMMEFSLGLFYTF